MKKILEQQSRLSRKHSRITEETKKTCSEWPLPCNISLFLPEFPIRLQEGQNQLEFLGIIAKGCYGLILKAKDHRRENIYAVKILSKAEVLRRSLLKQCKEEGIIQRQLRGPFVHRLEDCWQSLHHIFIMCEYCSAGDLHRLWSENGQFPEKTIRVYAAEIGSALGFLHDFGIIHRDVKMENILLDSRGHLKLTDFGLSRQLKRGQKTYTICGTMQYTAPEVLSGGPYNHTADWWSLGILLFSLRTGELLCKNPLRRLHLFSQFQNHPFFHGLNFDPVLLQKLQMEFNQDVERTMAMQEVDPFQDFDHDLVTLFAFPSPV
ncbi:ribosomal protein S6 kinase-related protein [Protopterus annectens]|uniref:ribosomal protein S6 kinase-related protein n=1 Tax=Protopterus annectens TaxID=7888 RepID=UPI001CFBF34E|nr:ribosomal protein S6 kinase-related protein [Protopterus annectens]